MTDAWTWRPSKSAWHEKFNDKILRWQPEDRLGLDGEPLKASLIEANAREADWLRHPCMNSITYEGHDKSPQRDLQVAIWTAANAPTASTSLTAPQPLTLWSPVGGYRIEAGTYDLNELAGLLPMKEWPYDISVDVGCHSLGFPIPDTWVEHADLSADEQARMTREVTNALEILVTAAKKFPECVKWVSDVTRVLIPLRSSERSYFRSGSQADVPGMVYADLFGGLMQVMEAIVHESAHLHLFMAEASGPLVDPQHQGRYASPLRPEPRPLRGILLAFHAIAYICAFYREAEKQGFGGSAEYDAELANMLTKLKEAQVVLGDARQFLTEDGRVFVDRTAEIAYQ
ncbi:aKG-HExxH-type peptide beta-hydroxylase [Bradyrhizobium sp. HKCCYLRH3061]|uniref:aKG-HExxH-type peptide beta-hydroxylase n=1 Tax=Bradyrhizobium sp. HKCCYLRH3061 TaxID=3420734 RepID=UPI003EBE721F